MARKNTVHSIKTSIHTGNLSDLLKFVFSLTHENKVLHNIDLLHFCPPGQQVRQPAPGWYTGLSACKRHKKNIISFFRFPVLFTGVQIPFLVRTFFHFDTPPLTWFICILHSLSIKNCTSYFNYFSPRQMRCFFVE